jgi:hypothetical protein
MDATVCYTDTAVKCTFQEDAMVIDATFLVLCRHFVNFQEPASTGIRKRSVRHHLRKKLGLQIIE